MTAPVPPFLPLPPPPHGPYLLRHFQKNRQKYLIRFVDVPPPPFLAELFMSLVWLHLLPFDFEPTGTLLGAEQTSR